MNGQEKSVLEVVANDVKWIKASVTDIKRTFERQVEHCQDKFGKQEEKINNNKTKIWKLIVAVSLISSALGLGGSEIIHLAGG